MPALQRNAIDELRTRIVIRRPIRAVATDGQAVAQNTVTVASVLGKVEPALGGETVIGDAFVTTTRWKITILRFDNVTIDDVVEVPDLGLTLYVSDFAHSYLTTTIVAVERK